MGAWTRLVAFGRQTEGATPLALVRIGCGLTVLFILLPMWWQGLIEVLWMDEAHGGLGKPNENQWLIALLGGSASAVHILVPVAMLLGVAMVLGVGGFVTPLLLLQVIIALFSLHRTTAGGGHDRVLTNLLWMMVFARGDQTLSLRAWWATGRVWAEGHAPVWPRRLLEFQLVVMMTIAGLSKIGSHWHPWGDYSAVYYTMQIPVWQRLGDMYWLAHVYPLTQLATATTWWFEALHPLLLLIIWWRLTPERGGRLRRLSNRLDLRSWVGFYGLLLQFILTTTMNLGPFGIVTVTLTLVLWDESEYRRLWQRLTGRSQAQPVPA